jgi:hypothetical protein
MAPIRLARVALMAFDGFAIGRRLVPGAPCDHATIEAMVRLLLPDDLPPASASPGLDATTGRR